MAKKGVRKVDEIAWEDGSIFPIHLNLETGEFSLKIPSPTSEYHSLKTFTADNLATLKTEVLAWLKDYKTLKWEPVIVLRGEFNRNRFMAGGKRHVPTHSVEFKYSRAFRAKGVDGEWKWRNFGAKSEVPDPQYIYDANADVLEGQPGRPTEGPFDGNLWTDDKIIPYAPSHWKALLRISWMITEIHERINEIIDGGEDKIGGFLNAVGQKGMPALLPPKDKEVS